MQKRIWTLLICMAFLLSLITVPVSAEYQNRWTDGFEAGTGAVVDSDYGESYISNGDNGLLVSLYKTAGFATWTNDHMEVQSGVGYNGTAGLYLHCDTTKNSAETSYRSAAVLTRGIVLDDTAAVLRYRVKFLEVENGAVFSLSGVTGYGTPASSNVGWVAGYNTFEMNKWYTVVTHVGSVTAEKQTDGTYKAVSTIKHYILSEDNTLYNSKTTTLGRVMVDGSTVANTQEQIAVQPIYFWPVYIEATNYKTKMVLDDGSLTEVPVDQTKSIGLDSAASTISDDETGVEVTHSFRLTFDNVLADGAADTVKLYKASDTEKVSPITCTLSAETFDGFLLTPQYALDGETDYVLDLSGVTGAAGQAIADADKEISFTTAAAETDVVSSSPASGATDVSSELKTMTVTFNKAMQTYPQTVSLVSANDTITANVTTSDKIAFTLTWTDELDGMATYSVNLGSFKDAKGDSTKTTALSFTVGTADIVQLTDSFETGTLINDAKTSYNADGTGSLLTMSASTRPGSDVDEVSLVEGFTAGKNALQLKTGSESGKLYLNPLRTVAEHTFSDEEMLVATWRFRLDQAATFDLANKKAGARIGIGFVRNTNGSSGIWNAATAIKTNNEGKLLLHQDYEASSTAREIFEDKWYNITYVMGKSYGKIYFVDAETGELVYENQNPDTRGGIQRIDGDYNNYILLACGDVDTASVSVKTTDLETGETVSEAVSCTVNQNQTFTVDDFTLWKIKPGRSTHKLAKTAYSADDDGTLTMEFNQPVLADRYDMTLYETTDDVKKSAYSTADVAFSDFCTQTISFTHLKDGHSYELDYSALVALSGAPAAENSIAAFSTAPSSEELSVYDDVTCTGLDAGDTVNFKLISKAADTASLMVGFYNRSGVQSLEGVELLDNYALSAGENDVAVTLSKSMQNAEYIKVFAFDSTGNLMPLIEECEIVAPKRHIRVLLIGTSMAEDTGRHLYDVAKAAGQDIEVRVMGVGGSNLDIHARNIKEELAGRTGTDTLTRPESEQRLYFTYVNGVCLDRAADNVTLTDTLKNQQFDVIGINDMSSTGCYTTEGATRKESLSYIMGEIRKLQPNAQLVYNQTWGGYQQDVPSRRAVFEEKIEPAVQELVEYVAETVSGITPDDSPMLVVPSGRAFNIVDKKHDMFMVPIPADADSSRPAGSLTETDEFNEATGLFRDQAHGSYYGCYLADACWYEFLTGRIAPVVDANGNPAVPKPTAGEGANVSDAEHIERLKLLRDCAHEAILDYKK